MRHVCTYHGCTSRKPKNMQATTHIAKFTGPTWGPPGYCRPQMGPMLAAWTLLSGYLLSNPQQLYAWHTRFRHIPLTDSVPSKWNWGFLIRLEYNLEFYSLSKSNYENISRRLIAGEWKLNLATWQTAKLGTENSKDFFVVVWYRSISPFAVLCISEARFFKQS